MAGEDFPWSVRAVFIAGIVGGVVTLVSKTGESGAMLGVNFHVYYLAAETVLAGGSLYAVAAPGFPSLPYVYPPIVAVVFLPFLVFGDWSVAFVVFTMVNVGAGVVLGVVVLRLARGRGVTGTVLDRWLVVGYCVGSTQMMGSLYYGNVNPLLAMVFAIGVWYADRGEAGVAGGLFAVPAVVKVFPAGFGAYFVVRRSWRGVVAAVAAGVSAFVVSVVAFGMDAHIRYVEAALVPRRRTTEFVGGLAPGAEYLTLRRPLSLLLPNHPELLGPIAAVVLAGVVAAVVYWGDPTGDLGALVCLYAVVAGVLLALPSYQLYYVFVLPALIPLLLAAPGGRARQGVTAGAFLGTIPVELPDLARVLGTDSGVGEVVYQVAEPVLTVGTPPLYGVVITLIAGVVLVRNSGSYNKPSNQPP